MATLEQLRANKALTKIGVPKGTVGSGRTLYVTAVFTEWYRLELPKIQATHYGDNVPALDQVKDLLGRFLAGKPLEYEDEFKDLKPTERGVWELKTGDVRIFGWFPEFDVFVATNGADKNWLIEDSGPNYEVHIECCELQRCGLELDEPKFIPSQDPSRVISS